MRRLLLTLKVTEPAEHIHNNRVLWILGQCLALWRPPAWPAAGPRLPSPQKQDSRAHVAYRQCVLHTGARSRATFKPLIGAYLVIKPLLAVIHLAHSLAFFAPPLVETPQTALKWMHQKLSVSQSLEDISAARGPDIKALFKQPTSTL